MSQLNALTEVNEHNDHKEQDQNNNIVSEWLKKFESNSLTELDFRNYWTIFVPRFFKPKVQGNSLDWSHDEQKAQQVLFKTLEEFIFNKKSIDVLHDLTQQNYPPSVCGRIFKMGDITYKCRECGIGTTCVLCVDCFKQSPHKNHKYKIATSCGGGCCDCGSVEAWKMDPHCQIHKLGLEKKHVNLNFLSNDMEKRAHLVFQYVLRYTRALLTFEHNPMLPVELDSDESVDDLRDIYKNQEDSFCIVIYNDKTHTFDQLSNILTRFIKCSVREIVNFVTTVDQNGRVVVKCDDYIQCNVWKDNIDNFTTRYRCKPLKIFVVHSYVIAHQTYALRLLTWMQNLLGFSNQLRTVFCDVVLASTPTECSIIESILVKDTILWKAARLNWHNLFIAGMFKEYENKKEFSKIFTKNYVAVMKDFINDDHDYSYSVVSLGIQIFSIPSLANYLIVHHDVLSQLLNSFSVECLHNVNEQGKLEFQKNTPTLQFRRAQYTLGHIRFILNCVPLTWNPKLRETFCQAVFMFLDILNYIQNMDAVEMNREFFPDSEPGFNLHNKFRLLITKILLWCGSDSITLEKIYKRTLKKLWENVIIESQKPSVVKEMLNIKVNCIDYDVSKEPVSIHLPLSRFLAGLHLYLERFGFSFYQFELQTAKLSPEQMIEPVLRIQVLISQIHADMWEPTGHLLSNQAYFYKYSKRCKEMLDKDIVILQMGASLINSNEFLIHVLNKFDLLEFLKEDNEHFFINKSEQCIQQTINLIEDFLNLIITIVGERYTPGVGKVTIDDCIKKEVIQQLCVKPMPHSELKKILLNIIDDEGHLDKIINEVAEFKKTQGKGVYELKPIYYDDYNVFFYHYSRAQISKSEKEQRKRKKTAGDLDCCPPPCLPLFSDDFAKIANLLQCDIMFYVIKLILDRTVNLSSKSFSESQLHKVLHLIGYALHEEEKQQSPSFTFIECSKSYGIEVALEKLKHSPRVEDYKDLVTWTLQKFRQVAGPRTNPVTTDVVENTEDVKRNHLELEKQKRAKIAADRRLAVMAHFTQMQNNFMKDNAIFFENNNNDNIMLFENTAIYPESHNDSTSMDILKNISEQPVALGPHQTTPSTFNNKYKCILCQEEQLVTYDSQALVLATFVQKSSVLCQLRSGLNNINEHFSDQYYIPANFGPSPHISTCGHVMHISCWQQYFDLALDNQNRRSFRLRQASSFDLHKNEYLCPHCKVLCNTVIPLLPHVSSFAETNSIKIVETLTFEYWLDGLNMALKQINAKPNTAIKSISELEVEEQNKSTKPVMPKRLKMSHKLDRSLSQEVVTNIGETSILKNNSEILDESDETDEEELPPSNLFSIGTNDFFMQKLTVDKSLPKVVPKVSVSKNSELSTSLVDTILKFAKRTYSKALGYSNPHPHNNHVPLLTWKACAYTIHSNEVILRYTNKPLLGELTFRQKACLEALVHVSGILGSTWKKEHEINLHALRLLSITLDNGGNNSIGILDWDAFGMLVALTMTIPSLYYTEVPMPASSGTMLDFHTLILMFIANLVQIILTIDIKENSEEMDIEGAEDTFCLTYLIHKLRGINIKNTVVVWCLIEKCALPFLRCCCLFYHFFTGIPASGVLTEIGGDTYHNMCCYLGLPTTCKALLDKPYVEVLINKWAENEKLIKIRKGEKIQFRDWTHINELVQLPEDYSELLDTVSMFTCPNSDHGYSRTPTMCLVCGVLLCSQNFCCRTDIKRIRVGACCNHAYSCGCGVGIFLRVRHCEVSLLATLNKGCFKLSPYLDEYGETDQGLKRGNPLFLCKDQYRKLQILWLSHGLHEEISRFLYSINDHLPINLLNHTWQLM